MEMVNIDLSQDGVVRPRKGFKTFRGFVYQMWLINRRYKKMGVEGNFTVKLPLPEDKPVAMRFTSDMYKFNFKKPQ